MMFSFLEEQRKKVLLEREGVKDFFFLMEESTAYF